MTRFKPQGPHPKALSSAEFRSRLGALKIVEPFTRQAFIEAEDKIWRDKLEDSPHGDPWHTSFHASQFPGSDPRACGRYQQYVLLDDPGKEAVPRKLRGQAAMGQAVEKLLLDKWGACELLDVQGDVAFVDGDYWLTGNCDAIIVPPGWNRPHVIEVKTKSQAHIEEMKNPYHVRKYDEKHKLQCKTYIGFAHENADRWPQYEPCIDGTIYYCSRDEPSQTHEFYFTYDPRHMEEGRKKLEEVRDAYVSGDLLPHPFGGKQWSIDPCKWCKFKRDTCKPDHKAGVTKLKDSHSVARAKEIYGDDFSYEAARKAVLTRWNAEDKDGN